MPEGWRSPLESDPNDRCNFSANQRTHTVCLLYGMVEGGDRTGLRIGRGADQPGPARRDSTRTGPARKLSVVE
ncbi:hypothetical protein ACWCOZ_07575 [Streptomyces sp. NPDC001840]